MADKRKVSGERTSDDTVERPAADDLPILENRKVDMSAAHPRQERVIELLEQYRARAAAGEIVGVVITYVRADGGWGMARDLAAADMRAAIGELELAQHDLVELLVEARSTPTRDRCH